MRGAQIDGMGNRRLKVTEKQRINQVCYQECRGEELECLTYKRKREIRQHRGTQQNVRKPERARECEKMRRE